jgi:hypothetical protein
MPASSPAPPPRRSPLLAALDDHRSALLAVTQAVTRDGSGLRGRLDGLGDSGGLALHDGHLMIGHDARPVPAPPPRRSPLLAALDDHRSALLAVTQAVTDYVQAEEDGSTLSNSVAVSARWPARLAASARLAGVSASRALSAATTAARSWP